MSQSLSLFGDRFMILAVLTIKFAVAIWASITSTAPLVQEEPGLVKILFISGSSIQFTESYFDFLMSRWVSPFIGIELITDQVSVFCGDI